jgi:hypothetical protein
LLDAGKTEDIDVQHLAGLPRRFEIGAGIVPQTEVQAFARRGLLDHVGVTLQLIADCRSDEVSAVRIESASRVVKKFERWTNLKVVARRQAYRARELGQRVLKVFRGFSIS